VSNVSLVFLVPHFPPNPLLPKMRRPDSHALLFDCLPIVLAWCASNSLFLRKLFELAPSRLPPNRQTCFQDHPKLFIHLSRSFQKTQRSPPLKYLQARLFFACMNFSLPKERSRLTIFQVFPYIMDLSLSFRLQSSIYSSPGLRSKANPAIR